MNKQDIVKTCDVLIDVAATRMSHGEAACLFQAEKILKRITKEMDHGSDQDTECNREDNTSVREVAEL